MLLTSRQRRSLQAHYPGNPVSNQIYHLEQRPDPMEAVLQLMNPNPFKHAFIFLILSTIESQ
jgi:hypothetical protein